MNQSLTAHKQHLFFDKIRPFCTVKTFQVGDVVLNENAYIKSIPIVTKGVLKVSKMEEDGREILLYYIRAGESCVMSFLGGIHNEKSKVKAEVEEEAELLLLPMENVSQFIKSNPEFLDYIFRLYHKRFEELLDIVNTVAFKKMNERLLELLKKKAEMSQTKELQVTHEQLANELGTARVVVSRLLKEFELDGVLKLSRNKISLL
jgi:CRP/FNR family transcriptional regulator